MNNHKFFRNTAIAFGLLAASTGFAAETSTAAPAVAPPEMHEVDTAGMGAKMEKMTPEQREAFRAEMKAKIDKMTPEQRDAIRTEMKAKWEKMTPEQRAEFKEHRAERMQHRAEHMEHTEHPGK